MANTQCRVPLSENARLINQGREAIEQKVEERGNDVIPNVGHKEMESSCDNDSNTTHQGSGTMDGEQQSFRKKSGWKIFKGVSQTEKCTLVLMTTSAFLTGTTFTLVGPIYPFEASRKGMSPAMTGLVFGIFGAVIFCTTPFFGNYLTHLGPKFTFNTGIFVGGCCNILFGTLYYCPGGTPFAVFSMLIRVTEAVGFSAYTTACLAIASSQFKENIGFTLGILEMGNGIGYMVGPIIAGALYNIGGFSIPFYVAGVAVLINGLLVFVYLPTVECTPTQRTASMARLLVVPTVAVPVLCTFLGDFGISTFLSTFAKHAERLDISVGETGFLFGVLAMIYSLASLVWGYISDAANQQAPLMVSGLIVFGIGYLLLGPTSLFPNIPFTLTTVYIGLTLVGASFGGFFIPSMKCMVQGAVESGFDDSIDTYAMISGLFNSALTLGQFVGPVTMSAMVQGFGFPIAYTVVGMLAVGMAAVCAVFFTIRHFRKEHVHINNSFLKGEQ